VGRIISFYSDRDGIGRSMAVATVAWVLASNGRRVLAIDWDFGKPTLYKYFGPLLGKKADRGLIDYLWEYARSARRLPRERREAYSVRPPEIERRRCNSGGTGQLDVILAGEVRTSGIRARYFSWAEFFDQLFGRHLLQTLFTRFSAEYDFVLADLPSGAIMRQALMNVGRLSDDLVACFSYDVESIEQTVQNVSAVVSAQREKPRLVPVAMMVETVELELILKARLHAEKRFEALHAVAPALNQEVPYVPYYRYQIRSLPTGDFFELQSSLLRLAEVINSARGLQWIDPWEKTAISYPPTLESADQEQVGSWVPTPYEGDGPYIFVSYARDEKDLMLLFIRDLTQLGFPVWWDEEIPGGAEWSAYLERKIIEAKFLMVFVSMTSASSVHVAQEISLAERSHKPILSIRLDATDLREEMGAIVSKYQTLQSDSPTFHEDLAKAIRVLGLD
jgi:MinD-like ATPase involved in chromosome partitioning or flagellar assembly